VNIRKQKIVQKTLDYYKSTGESSVVLYEDIGLSAQQIKNVKKALWNVGEIACIKNTLFERFLKEKNFQNYEILRGNNVAIFCKDAFTAIHWANMTIKKLKIDKKFVIQCSFIDKNYFNKLSTSALSRYSSVSSIHASVYMSLKSPMIMLWKILTLATENKVK
jgi:ribosomal protein L10